MKRAIILFAALILIVSSALTAYADEGKFFKMELDSIRNEYKTGETFYVKAALNEITAPNGITGVSMHIEYDPSKLELLEADDGGVVEVALPEKWTEIAERKENADVPGSVNLIYDVTNTGNGAEDLAVKADEMYVILKFRAVSEGKTSVRIDGADANNVCRGYDENGSAVSYSGKGSEIEFTINGEGDNEERSAPESTVEEKSYALYYVIVGAVIAAAAAVLLVTKLKKNK